MKALKTLAVLTLSLAGCQTDNGPTAWIPRNGALTGTVTVNNVSLLSPQRSSAPVASEALLSLAFRHSAGLDAFRGWPLPVIPATLVSRRYPPVASSDLIVTFRSAALGAPPVGSMALRSPRLVAPVARAIRSHLAAMLPVGTAVAGVSPVIMAARVRVADPSRRDAIAAQLERDSNVASVSSNHLMWLDQTPYYRVTTAANASGVMPNNPLYPYQTWHYGLIDAPRAWAVSTGSATVLVAVVDDGIRFDHPAIAANLTTDGYDFVSDADTLSLCSGGTITNADDGGGPDPDPTIPASYSPDSTGTCFIPSDLGNHGLHVAGTIGAVGNSGIGVTGVNWQVRIRPVRVLGVGGFGSSYDVAQGVLYAAGLPADNGAGGTVQAGSGARIINLSLGSSQNDTTLQRAVASAIQAGALVVAAAGNAGTSDPVYPAAYPEVVGVAAVGPDGAPAPYSNYGSYVAVRAPGGNFALGDATDGVMSTIWNFNTSSPDYAWAVGTSMATPHVSGVAALVLSQSPSLSASELRSRLITYATGQATQYGAGLVNAYNSVTASHGPASKLYARLYRANDWAVTQTVEVDANGGFTFGGVGDGTYHVYAGTVIGTDQPLGSPGTMWGAYGGPMNPGTVAVLGPVHNPLAFSIGFPTSSANHFLLTAAELPIGGYMQSRIVNPDTLDVFKVHIARTGTYTFETFGWVGACGVALEEATAIGLFSSAGTLLTFTGFIDQTHFNYCSRLTLNLNPGTYYVGVAGALGRRYRVQARAGT